MEGVDFAAVGPDVESGEAVSERRYFAVQVGLPRDFARLWVESEQFALVGSGVENGVRDVFARKQMNARPMSALPSDQISLPEFESRAYTASSPILVT